jgi:hypothetical protein
VYCTQAYESERLWWYCEEMMDEATRWVEAWRARQLKCIETSLKESAADPSNKVRARACLCRVAMHALAHVRG